MLKVRLTTNEYSGYTPDKNSVADVNIDDLLCTKWNLLKFDISDQITIGLDWPYSIMILLFIYWAKHVWMTIRWQHPCNILLNIKRTVIGFINATNYRPELSQKSSLAPHYWAVSREAVRSYNWMEKIVIIWPCMIWNGGLLSLFYLRNHQY